MRIPPEVILACRAAAETAYPGCVGLAVADVDTFVLVDFSSNEQTPHGADLLSYIIYNPHERKVFWITACDQPAPRAVPLTTMTGRFLLGDLADLERRILQFYAGTRCSGDPLTCTCHPCLERRIECAIDAAADRDRGPYDAEA